jgi:hypothetical protein
LTFNPLYDNITVITSVGRRKPFSRISFLGGKSVLGFPLLLSD